MNVCDLMSSPALVIAQDATLESAAALMLQHRVGCLPVVDAAGTLTGILTESDFSAKEQGVPFSAVRLPQIFGRWMPHHEAERIYEGARNIKVEQVMTKDAVTIADTAPIETAIHVMLRHRVHRLPVVRNGVPIGVLARHDLLRLMLR